MFVPSCSGRLLLKELEMPPAHTPVALLVIALWVAPCFTAVASAGGEPVVTAAERQDAAVGQTQLDASAADWQGSFTATLARAQALLQAGYVRAPALVIVLGAFVVLPAVAMISFLFQPPTP